MRKEIEELQIVVNKLLTDKDELKILEAGCGSSSHIHFYNKISLVGIDISKKQLEKNTCLNEKILGDIQTYNFSSSTFDVIICWDVLEHLSRPVDTLVRFTKAIKKDGIIILKLPNVYSIKGLFTKYTPYFIHVLFYKYIQGVSNYDEDEKGPFRTYLKFSISPNAIKKFAVNNGLACIYFIYYDVSTADWFRKNKILYTFYIIIKTSLGFISMGKLSDSEFICVLKKI